MAEGSHPLLRACNLFPPPQPPSVASCCQGEEAWGRVGAVPRRGDAACPAPCSSRVLYLLSPGWPGPYEAPDTRFLAVVIWNF